MSNSLDRVERGVFQDLQALFDNDRFITTDRYLEFAERNHQDFYYVKRDFIFRSGNFRDIEYPTLTSRFNEYRSKVLIMGHSDLATNTAMARLLKLLGISRVFSTNSLPLQDFVHPIPLGLTNNCDDSPIHRIFGDHSLLLKASSVSDFPEKFAPIIYTNFTSSNNKRVRGLLLKQLTNLPKEYVVNRTLPDFSVSGRVKYLIQCRSSNFVLCPEGNGVDTHRLWETLYMGGVPIIKRNPMLTNLVDGLPVIQVDSWKQINSMNFLEEQWHQVQELSWDKSRLSIDYWWDRFLTIR